MVVLSFLFSFAIMLLRKRELVSLISVLFILWGCDRFLCLFLAVSRVGLSTMFEHFLVKQTVHNYLNSIFYVFHIDFRR